MLFPNIVQYRGRTYRLVEAVMPAKAAEVKMNQLRGAVERAPQARVVNSDQWDLGEGGILDITSKKDGGSPMLVMWNPITSEMLISSSKDTNIALHSDLFKRNRGKLKDYPLPHIRDWVRSSIDSSTKEIVLWPWDPLFAHVVYLNTPRELTEMERIHAKGLTAFKQVMTDLGAGSYKFRTINL